MPIYLDHAATTPLRPEALEAMLPFLGDEFGNPSSPHAWGRRARTALDEAHEQIATALGTGPREIVLTSGGTEALNLALKGAAWAGKVRGHRILTTAVEHHAVLHPLQQLEKFGFEIVELAVDRYGRLDPDVLSAALTDHTILVAIGHANNEVGTIQPLAELVRRVRRDGPKGCLVAVDAIASVPYLPVDVAALDVDILAVAAHKFEGPKGAGALYLRAGTHILSQQQGGSQERFRRAGTEDVAAAVGMGVALQLAVAERDAVAKRLRRARERLVRALTAIGGVEQTGHPSERIPGLVSIVIRDVDGASVVMKLDLEGVAASVGSACTTGSAEPSHVLRAMGYPEEEARGSLRLSMGRSTTETEIGNAVEIVPLVVGAARSGAQKLNTAQAGSVAGRIGLAPRDGSPLDDPSPLGSRAGA
jgi:cysteine desulfurase